jgi:hypothetical protein
VHYTNPLEFCLIVINTWINTWYKGIIITEIDNHISFSQIQKQNHQNPLQFSSNFLTLFSLIHQESFIFCAIFCFDLHLQVQEKNCLQLTLKESCKFLTVATLSFNGSSKILHHPSTVELSYHLHSPPAP